MIATHGEEPDAIGWRAGGDSYLVECKASQADLLADRQKFHRQHPELGIGRNRYLLVSRESGIKVRVGDLNGWGLLEAHKGRVRKVIGAVPFMKYNVAHEATILLSSIRRIGTTAPRGISIRVYTHQTRNRASIIIAP